MKKILLLSSLLYLTGISSANAVTCTSVPSCTDLGYTSISSCTGTIVKCPFDANYGVCITDSSCNAITKYTGTLSYPVTISSLVKTVTSKCTYGLCPTENLRDMLSSQSGILLTDEDFAHNIYNGGMVSTTDVLLANKNIYYACRKAPTLKCRVGDYLNLPSGGSKSCTKTDQSGQNYKIIKNDGNYIYYTNNTITLPDANIKTLPGSYSYADLYKSTSGCIYITSDDLKSLTQTELTNLFGANKVEVLVEDHIVKGGVQLVYLNNNKPTCCQSAIALATDATAFVIPCKGVGRIALSSSGDPTGKATTDYTSTYMANASAYSSSVVLGGGSTGR